MAKQVSGFGGPGPKSKGVDLSQIGRGDALSQVDGFINGPAPGGGSQGKGGSSILSDIVDVLFGRQPLPGDPTDPANQETAEGGAPSGTISQNPKRQGGIVNELVKAIGGFF